MTKCCDTNITTPAVEQIRIYRSTMTYNPYIHRQNVELHSNGEAFIMLLNGLLSNKLVMFGTLFGRKGLLGAVVIISVVAIWFLLALNTLVRCQHVMCRKLETPYLTFQKTMKLALLGGPKLLRIFLPFTSFCDSFLIISTTIVSAYFLWSAAVACSMLMYHLFGYKIDPIISNIALILPMLIIHGIPSPKVKVVLSAISSMSYILVLGILMYNAYYLPPHNHTIEIYVLLPFKRDVEMSVGLVSGLECLVLFMSVEEHMRKPSDFTGICGLASLSMYTVLCLNCFYGGFMYVCFGPEVPFNILRAFSMELLSMRIVYGLWIVSMAGTSIVRQSDVANLVWRSYLEKRFMDDPKKDAYSHVTRIVVFLLAASFPVIVPNLNFIYAYISAFYAPILCFAFPGLLQFCVLYPHNLGPLYWRALISLSHFIFGILGFGFSLKMFNRSMTLQFETFVYERNK